MPARMTEEIFLEKAKEICKNDNYDFSLIHYVNMKTYVQIKCLTHDTIFNIRPEKLLLGQGCPLCKVDKIKATKLKRYGSETYNNGKKANSTKEKKGIVARNSKVQYVFENEVFDSSWELCYWIWNKDQGIEIKRNIQYFQLDNGHSCIPDFEVNGKLVEIKGDFLKKQEIWPLKEKCYKENGIQILFSKDIKQYVKYVLKTYGKDFILLHRRSKTDLKPRFIEYKCEKCGILFNDNRSRIHARLRRNTGILCRDCAKMVKSEKLRK